VQQGIDLARQFAAAAEDPGMQMMLPLIVEEMLEARDGALANSVGGAFLVELARLASVTGGP
jgi:hypothetical protein